MTRSKTRIAILAAVGVTIVAVATFVLLPQTRPTALAWLDRIGLGGTARRVLGPTPGAPGVPAAPRVVAAPPAVTVVEAIIRPFRDQLFVSGTLVAREEALVGAQIDGLRIDAVLAEDGDQVQEGQVLARLDRTQLATLLIQSDATIARADAAIAQARSQVLQFEATTTQAASDLARGRQLGQGIISQSTLDQRLALTRTSEAQLAGAKGSLAVALAERKSQDAQRRELEVRIARTDVRAPVAGIVSRRSARVGAQTGGSEPLFRIVQGGSIDLDAEAPDDVLARATIGMAAQVTLAGIDTPVVGTVRLISNEVDKATRLGRVRIGLPGVGPGRTGSFASAVIDIARRDGVAVPASSVTRGERGRAVQVVRDGKVEVRQVEVGLAFRDLVEITRGLESGEGVVARAAVFLRSGDIVRPVAAALREAAR